MANSTDPNKSNSSGLAQQTYIMLGFMAAVGAGFLTFYTQVCAPVNVSANAERRETLIAIRELTEEIRVNNYNTAQILRELQIRGIIAPREAQ